MTEVPPGPRWRQIAQAMQAVISTLPPGARLPTEAALAAQHGVNRHTVRRAIEHLGRAGLVRSEQGRGSFVMDDIVSYAVAPRTRFSEWVRRNNREPTGHVVQLRTFPATAAVAAELALHAGAPVTMIERVGLADRVPVTLSRTYFDATRFPGLLDRLRHLPSISAALAAEGLTDFRRQRTRVTARLPTAAEASLLQAARTRPVLVCANLDVDGPGRPVGYAIVICPSARVQVVFEP